MKKGLLCIFVCFLGCLTVMFCGCSKTADLYQLGLQMTTQLEEIIKSDFYAEIIGLAESCNETRKSFIANDYDSPVKVYSITAPDSYTMLEKMAGTDEEAWNQLSDTIKEQLLNKFTMQTLFININANSDMNTLAVVSLFYVSTQFENYSLKEDITYLYMFETGKPVAVTFTADNDRIQATAYFVLLPQTSTLSDIREIFTPFGCTVNLVSP